MKDWWKYTHFSLFLLHLLCEASKPNTCRAKIFGIANCEREGGVKGREKEKGLVRPSARFLGSDAALPALRGIFVTHGFPSLLGSTLNYMDFQSADKDH